MTEKPCFFLAQEIARVLIVEGGADVNTKDERGRSIIDLSQHYNRALKTDVLMAFMHERYGGVLCVSCVC